MQYLYDILSVTKFNTKEYVRPTVRRAPGVGDITSLWKAHSQLNALLNRF